MQGKGFGLFNVKEVERISAYLLALIQYTKPLTMIINQFVL